MSDTLITESDLRQAVRDPRYWQPGHPERAEYAAWVTEGWQALARGEAGGTRQVRVRAYSRRRHGQVEHVDSYIQTRQSAQRQDRRQGGGAPAAREAPATAPQAPPTFVLFIGGAADARFGIVRRYRQQMERELGTRNNEYFAHDERDRILQRIAAQPEGTRIVLVGHSWGGDQAAQIAARLGTEGRPVDLLVTVDPVGSGLSEGFMRRVRSGAREWINIRATGGPWDEESNLIARLGGRYGSLPASFATQHIEAPFTHRDFERMLRHIGPSGGSAWDRVLGP